VGEIMEYNQTINRAKAIAAKLLAIKREEKDPLIKETSAAHFLLLQTFIQLYLTNTPVSIETFNNLLTDSTNFVDKTWRKKDVKQSK
jgi:hypothetical protein